MLCVFSFMSFLTDFVMVLRCLSQKGSGPLRSSEFKNEGLVRKPAYSRIKAPFPKNM